MSENWKKGDIAICINVDSLTNKPGLTPPLRLNSEYIVQGVKICVCGFVTLDVGLPSRTGVIQCECDRIVMNEPIWWCTAKRFVKKKTDTFADELIEQALKIEECI